MGEKKEGSKGNNQRVQSYNTKEGKMKGKCKTDEDKL